MVEGNMAADSMLDLGNNRLDEGLAWVLGGGRDKESAWVLDAFQ